MTYHAWDADAVGYDNGGQRAMWIDRLEFLGGTPIVHGPTAEPQRAP
jgi:hypothetical protein